MRMLPFFKPKKGFMVAGGGLETSAGGGGGGGGFIPPQFSNSVFNTGYKWVDGSDIKGIVITGKCKNGITAYPLDIDINTVIGLFGTVKVSANNQFPINYTYSNQQIATDVRYSIDGLKLYIQIASLAPADVPFNCIIYFI